MTDFRVRREDIYWRWIADDDVAAGLLPKVQTDISLTSDSRKIIIDCKFTPEATQQHYDAETLRSALLYQNNAYMDNLPDGKFRDTCEMMLLIPRWVRPFRPHSPRRVTRSASAPSTSTNLGS